LVHLAEQLPRSVSENELARFKNKGIILLKQGG
jgi:hypothetical protein